jgi:hypothetical protein
MGNALIGSKIDDRSPYYREDLFWINGLVHSCIGERMVVNDPSTFVVWTQCGMDVPANQSFSNNDGSVKVDCPDCISKLTGVVADCNKVGEDTMGIKFIKVTDNLYVGDTWTMRVMAQNQIVAIYVYEVTSVDWNNNDGTNVYSVKFLRAAAEELR